MAGRTVAQVTVRQPTAMNERLHVPQDVPGKGEHAARHGAATSRIAAEVGLLLAGGDVHAALGVLNARTRFRFTGVYAVEAPHLRNVELFDRENPALNVSGAICRLDVTYCSITAATPAPFSTDDAGRDSRLVAHAARDSVVSYAGVPVRLADGRVRGTLCHFDHRPRLVPPGELVVLDAVAPFVARWLLEHSIA